jgi:hypothetical protein
MRRPMLRSLAVLGMLAFLAAGKASAQYSPYYPGSYGGYGRPGGAPALSPYLDLRRGGNAAANYFLGVLPEIDRRRTKVEQGTAITDLERRTEMQSSQLQELDTVLSPLTGGGLPPTGHAAAFATYSTYYGLTAPAAPFARGPVAPSRNR